MPLYLSGTFGEPRTDHFHSGIDIRTNEVTGYSVRAIADGRISRIRVSSNGYGKAIYIQHPNGLTSVYGHLDHFNDQLEMLIRTEQTKLHSYTVDLSLGDKGINTKKGEVIAFSGNTGSSGGPHLHFELRETSSEKPVNPLLHGYTIQDNIRPVFKELYWYNLSDYYFLGATPLHFHAENDSTWVTDTLFVPENTPVGMGWKGYDQHDDVPNKNGLYSLSVQVNKSPIFLWQMHSFSFDETRYANCMVDYEQKAQGNGDIYQCFSLPGNRVSLLDNSPGRGVISAKAGDTLQVTISAGDYNGNYTYTRTTLIFTAATPTVAPACNAWPLRSFQYSSASSKVLIPGGSFYDSLALYVNTVPTIDPSVFSDVIQLHTRELPLHKPAEIYLLPQQRLTDKLAPKAIIVFRNFRGKESALPTKKSVAWYSASCREAGYFYIKLDTLPPEICLSNFNSENDHFYHDKIQAYITDDLAGIDKYDAWLDGTWFPMEYDAKNNLLFWKMEILPSGKKHSLKISVTDAAENTDTKSFNFIN